jgi:hypothetical protein
MRLETSANEIAQSKYIRPLPSSNCIYFRYDLKKTDNIAEYFGKKVFSYRYLMRRCYFA